MTRSHPPSLQVVVERTLREDCRLPKGSRVLLAISGGGDSMAMLHSMATLANRFELELRAHGVNHGLRSEAKGELDCAEEFAKVLSIPFSRSVIDVSRGANLQARARNQRYAELRKVAHALSAQWIATAHHADDRAETVLMRLMRGSGPSGLAVLAPSSADLIRPMIRVRKSDITSYLQRYKIQFAEDPSNSDARYLRSRVRYGIMPKLTEESSGIVAHLNSLADRMLELSEDGSTTSFGLTKSQAESLRRWMLVPRDGAEIALKGGWVLKFERRKIRMLANAKLNKSGPGQ